MKKLIKSPKQINQCKYFVCIWIGRTAMISNLKKKKKKQAGDCSFYLINRLAF